MLIHGLSKTVLAVASGVVLMVTTDVAAEEGYKEEWTRKHKTRYTKHPNRENLLVYSDGSLRSTRGRRRTGYGVVAVRGGVTIGTKHGSTISDCKGFWSKDVTCQKIFWSVGGHAVS